MLLLLLLLLLVICSRVEDVSKADRSIRHRRGEGGKYVLPIIGGAKAQNDICPDGPKQKSTANYSNIRGNRQSGK